MPLESAKELLAELEAVRAQGWCGTGPGAGDGPDVRGRPGILTPKVVAAVNFSLQAQSVAAQPDQDAYVASVAQETMATAKLISADRGTY